MTQRKELFLHNNLGRKKRGALFPLEQKKSYLTKATMKEFY